MVKDNSERYIQNNCTGTWCSWLWLPYFFNSAKNTIACQVDSFQMPSTLIVKMETFFEWKKSMLSCLLESLENWMDTKGIMWQDRNFRFVLTLGVSQNKCGTNYWSFATDHLALIYHPKGSRSNLCFSAENRVMQSNLRFSNKKSVENPDTRSSFSHERKKSVFKSIWSLKWNLFLVAQTQNIFCHRPGSWKKRSRRGKSEILIW